MISFVLLNKTHTSFSRPNFKPQWSCISNNWCMTKTSCFSCSQGQDVFWKKLMLCNLFLWDIKWKKQVGSIQAIPSTSPSIVAVWPGSKQQICTRSRVCPLLPGRQHSYKRREETVLSALSIWVVFEQFWVNYLEQNQKITTKPSESQPGNSTSAMGCGFPSRPPLPALTVGLNLDMTSFKIK